MGYPEGPNDPLRLFTQQPYYSPIPMSPGLMNNPLGLGLSIYGAPMLQQLAGPGNFVPNQMAAGFMTDQYQAYQHQRRTLGASLSAGRKGRDTLQNTIAGIAGVVSGQKPSELTRQQADFAAGIVNDPFAKMFLGSVMGPEMMEDVLYGTKGDPAALASAIGRTGFYQRDSLGGQRMTRQSIEQMTDNVYSQLYGEGADVEDMRGFGAGRAGQMYEHLFQTGRMPQSIGALSAADRVRAVAAGPRDEKTLDRLSEEFTHRELMETGATVNGKRYSELTREEQKSEVAKRLPEARRRIEGALSEVDKFAAGDSGAKSASEIEQLTGFGEMARNVDSSKAVKTLKGYAGAVKAVQEIFGAAGNPNAPMPALLAMLDQLSGGSVSMSPTRMESNVRQLHNAAKDAGMGPEQMLQIHQMQAATNRAMGIGAEADMPGAASVIRSLKAAADEGLFGEGFGRMSKADVAQELASRNARALTSRSGTKLAALMRMVENNPETMGADTDAGRLAAAVKAKERTFVNSKGETVDIGQLLASQNGLNDIVESAGGTVNDLEVLAGDRETIERYGDANYVQLVGQRAEVRSVLADELYGDMKNYRHDTPEARQLRAQRQAAGMTDEQLAAQSDEMDQAITGAVVEGLFEKTNAKMNDREKFAVMAPVVKDAIRAKLRASGVTDEKELERQTNIEFTSRYGATEQQQASAFTTRHISMANHILGERFGTTVAAEQQLGAKNAVNNAALDSSRTAAELAERQRLMNRGYETNVFQRLSDELQDIGSGNDVEFADRLESVINAVPVTKLAERGAPNLVAAMRDSVSFGAGKESLLRAYNTGRTEDISDAATMMAKQALGPDATPEKIKEFTEAVTAKDPAKLEALIAGMPKEQRDRFMLAASGLREAKDFSFGRLLGEELTPAQFQAQERREQIRGARKTAGKIDREVGQGDGVSRGFGQLMRAQTDTAKSAAIEEVARQILGPLGNDADVEDLAAALATGQAFTPTEMAQKKVADSYEALSREDQDKVDLVEAIRNQDNDRVEDETKFLAARKVLAAKGLIQDGDNFDFEHKHENGVLVGATLNGKDIDLGVAEEVLAEQTAISQAIQEKGEAAVINPEVAAHLQRKEDMGQKKVADSYKALSREDQDKVDLVEAIRNRDNDRIERETKFLAEQKVLKAKGLIQDGDNFDFRHKHENGVLVGATLNGKDIDLGVAEAVLAEQTAMRQAIQEKGEAAVINPEVAAHLQRKEDMAAGRYNFTESEQKQVVAALDRLTPERRDQIRSVARGVGAVINGEPLTQEDMLISNIVDIFGAKSAAQQFGPEATAALRSTLDNKQADNVKKQAEVIARSVLGKDADPADVERFATAMVAAGDTGEYGAVDDQLQYVDDDKKQGAREMIYGFNAARQLNMTSGDFDDLERRKEVEQGRAAVAEFSRTAQQAYANFEQSDTEENRTRLAQQIADEAKITPGTEKEEFIEAFTSGDPKKLDKALAVVTDPKRRAQIKQIAEGMSASAIQQSDAREAAARASGTADAKQTATDVGAPDADDVARNGDRQRAVSAEERAEQDRNGVTAKDVARDEDRKKDRVAEVEQIAETVVGAGKGGPGSEDDILQESATTAITAASAVAAAGTEQGGTRRGGGSEETKLSGTLKLQGLSEVIAELFADNNMEQTPDGGASVDLGQAMRAYRGSRPHVSGRTI